MCERECVVVVRERSGVCVRESVWRESVCVCERELCERACSRVCVRESVLCCERGVVCVRACACACVCVRACV